MTIKEILHIIGLLPLFLQAIPKLLGCICSFFSLPLEWRCYWFLLHLDACYFTTWRRILSLLASIGSLAALASLAVVCFDSRILCKRRITARNPLLLGLACTGLLLLLTEDRISVFHIFESLLLYWRFQPRCTPRAFLLARHLSVASIQWHLKVVQLIFSTAIVQLLD